MTARVSIVKHLHFSMNSTPTLLPTEEIDPVDSENDNENVDCQKPSFFNELEANSALGNPTGGNRPRRFNAPKSKIIIEKIDRQLSNLEPYLV